jgi:rhamnogalacturonyl hydrolase YesR
MLKVADWQLKHSNGKQENDWTNGALYSGIFAAYQTTNSLALMDSMMAMGDRKKWLAGGRYDHADDYAISQTYIDLYRISKDSRMVQSTIDSIKKMQMVPGKEVKNHGITWWWCDALFMAPPTMAKLSNVFSDPSYLVYSDTLFRQCYRLLFNQEEHLFARDASYLWDANGVGKKESNGKKLFWSRGNGWVMGGLVKLLQEMPKKYEGREFYVSLYKEMANRLLELQQADGLWRTSLLDPDAYPGGEGSGTGFDCYALAWGVNNKILDKKIFGPSVVKAWEGLNTLLTAEGKVGWVQPIGGDPRRNFNAESWEAYGAGAYLLAGSEVIKMKK